MLTDKPVFPIIRPRGGDFLYTENENEYYYEEENHPIKLIPELVIKHEDFGFELIDKNYIIQRIHINQPTE